jgi:phosphate-selective porin OprO/OprP
MERHQEMYRNKTTSRILTGLVIAAGFVHAQTPAQTNQQEIDQLRQQLDQLAQKQKADEAAATTAAAASTSNNASVTADDHGFTIKSNDGDFVLNIGADIQIDNRSFFGVGSQSLPDTILLRRARPVFQGTIYKYVDYFFRPDFGKGSVLIYDAYAELKYFSRAKLRVGKFKTPIGMERLQSDDDTTFVERGLPSLLVPQRDIGFQLAGDIVTGRVGYQVGVFNGVADTALADAAVGDHRDVAARIFATPFQPDADNPLHGLGFGIGVTGGNVDGEALPSYTTFGQNSFFTFASGVTEAGHRTRLQPQLYYYLGGFGLLSEYGKNEEGLQKGTFRTDMGFRAWQVEVSYNLTGEKKSFGATTPKRNFNPKNGGWGAWELAFRVGGFNADRAIYGDGFASPTTSPREAHERVGGVNWYLNRLFKIAVDYGNTDFGGGNTIALGGNKPEEKVVTIRFQLNFVGS